MATGEASEGILLMTPSFRVENQDARERDGS